MATQKVTTGTKKGSDVVPKVTKKGSVTKVTKKGSVPKVTKKVSDAVTKVTKKESATVPKDNKTTFITIDLETTGLINEEEKKFPHITQIAAMEMETSQLFSTYVLPKKRIEQEAEELTGIVVNGNEMRVHGQPVDPASIMSIEDALKKLCEWLDNFTNIMLVAHYGFGFDFQVMFKALYDTNTVELFLNNVTGLIDSLPLFRERFPGRSSYKHLDLAQSKLGKRYIAHNAINKAETLGKLVDLTNLSHEKLVTHMKPPQEFITEYIGTIRPFQSNFLLEFS